MRSRAFTRREAVQGILSEIEYDDAAFMVNLRAALLTIEVTSERALLTTAIAIQNTARGLSPVKTGRLRSSIVHVAGRDARGYYVDVGTNVNYAPHVEFGTVRMTARPYLRPALAVAAGYLGRGA